MHQDIKTAVSTLSQIIAKKRQYKRKAYYQGKNSKVLKEKDTAKKCHHKCTRFVLDLSSDSNNSINTSWCIFPFLYSSLVLWINIYVMVGFRGHSQDQVSKRPWKHTQREISFFKMDRIKPDSQRSPCVSFTFSFFETKTLFGKCVRKTDCGETLLCTSATNA